MNIFFHIGRYFILLSKVFQKPEKLKIYFEQFIKEISNLGLQSLGIVSIISLFLGAVITIQTAANLDTALIPLYTIGFAVRQSMVLELSPTIIALILAGKVGSNIASEIGTMRVTEQIDALEIMGINSAAFLIVPKILAAIFINPFLIILSMFIGILGGWLAATFTETVPSYDFLFGLQYDFIPFHITYALIKTLFFAFIITSVSAYHGYYTSGGSLEVGRSSTKAVVYSSIIILMVNYILTQLLLI
jgi:phospholipid/cholesterol/gamma-HCH transport system permease protein